MILCQPALSVDNRRRLGNLLVDLAELAGSSNHTHVDYGLRSGTVPSGGAAMSALTGRGL